MIKHYPYNELGTHDYGWLHARYHFSFAEYQNPSRKRFGALRVINDDIVKPGTGFDMHPHKNMEIITFVRKGAITHKDSHGNNGTTEAGDLQVMSAGTGIFHSEFNLQNEDLSLFQIWIEPKTRNVKPRWDSMKFPDTFVKETLPLLVSGDENDKDSLFINQDAQIYGGRIKKDAVITHNVKNQAYVLISEGTVTIKEKLLNIGDGAEITDTDTIKITAKEPSTIIIIDVPKQ
ncbi:MAG: pirin family protein [Bdellovibrionales bacterium]